jgi:hypothetical protein
MSLIDCSFTSSGELNLMNNGDLTAQNWLVKTSAQDATALVYNEGNLNLGSSFIENVECAVLEAVDSEGQDFVESSGGKITVINKGSIAEQEIVDLPFDSSIITIVAVVAVIIMAGVVVFMLKKKKAI